MKIKLTKWLKLEWKVSKKHIQFTSNKLIKLPTYLIYKKFFIIAQLYLMDLFNEVIYKWQWRSKIQIQVYLILAVWSPWIT